MSKKNKDTIGATAAGVASNVRGGGETEQLLTEKELQLELAAKQRDEYLQLAQRLKADYENLKKRADALAPKVREDTLVSVIETLLPVFDNLLLAKNGITDASIAKGIDLILKQFHDTLTTLGIKQVSAQGVPFDFNYHDCIQKVKDASVASGTVVNVLRQGYVLGVGDSERVIRHASVVIAE